MTDARICEMAPRDGLQTLNPERLVSVEEKVALVDALSASGLTFIEVGSFVSQRGVPQMANTDEVCRRIQMRSGVQYAALVPNLRHYERFQKSGLNTVALFVSASEAYSQFNVRLSVEESMKAAADVSKAARAEGHELRAHLSACFYDIDGGDSDVGCVVDLTHRLIDMDCDHVALADTKGIAHPHRVREVIERVIDAVGWERLAVHFHDSYGMGIANGYAAFECGIRIFDGSVGGVGGTPFSKLAQGPGGGGNIATEELVHMFDRMGVRTNVDVQGLLRCGTLVQELARRTGDPPPPSRLLR